MRGLRREGPARRGRRGWGGRRAGRSGARGPRGWSRRLRAVGPRVLEKPDILARPLASHGAEHRGEALVRDAPRRGRLAGEGLEVADEVGLVVEAVLVREVGPGRVHALPDAAQHLLEADAPQPDL